MSTGVPAGVVDGAEAGMVVGDILDGEAVGEGGEVTASLRRITIVYESNRRLISFNSISVAKEDALNVVGLYSMEAKLNYGIISRKQYNIYQICWCMLRESFCYMPKIVFATLLISPSSRIKSHSQ